MHARALSAQLFCRAEALGLRTPEALDLWLMATFLVRCVLRGMERCAHGGARQKLASKHRKAARSASVGVCVRR